MFASAAIGIALAAPRGAESAPAPAGLEEAYARRVAMIVGIDGYPDDPAVPDLRYAEQDARDIAAVLRDPDAGAFDHTIELIGGYVSQQAFWNSLEAATATLQREDTFVLYFAGHGTLELTPDGTQLYLLASDGVLDDPSRTGISLADVEDFVERLPARQRVMVVDACHSVAEDARSALTRQTEELLASFRGVVPSPKARDVSASEVFLYAAAHSQPAQEDPELENGVYTHFLVRGLQGEADENADGLVEVMELHAWVAAKTEAHTGGLQIPQVQARTVGREVIFLAGDKALRAGAEEVYRRRLEAMEPQALEGARGGDATRTMDPVEPPPPERTGRFRLVPFHGLRVGYAYVNTPAAVLAAANAAGVEVNPNYLLLGYELNQRLDGGGWLNLLLIENVLVAGLNQSVVRPQVNVLTAVDIRNFLEIGVGADWGPSDPQGRPWHMITGIGITPEVGNVNWPIHAIYMPDVDGYWRVGLTSGINWGGGKS